MFPARDVTSSQLIRRNDELALLYEKIKIQRAAISHGEIAYRDRLEDLRVLRLRENGLRRELHIQRSQASALDGLRAEVYTLQRELLQDRTKVKALSEELENPDNTHRWRKLEGSDPGTYEVRAFDELARRSAIVSCVLCRRLLMPVSADALRGLGSSPSDQLIRRSVEGISFLCDRWSRRSRRCRSD